ncbi:J domain-containing protein [Rhodoblastus sp. 17X3]|uniref:J domain-containing protein n=1 Tax=Rhodoblastus sp. 17X3 TaxID=3047026 RepID=UPI0031452E2E
MSLAGALKNVYSSLVSFGRDSGRKLEHIVLSSNVTLGAERPSDPGVAAWFHWDGLQVCIAVDRYATVEANLQAIHHIIEARRVELRHGTLALVHATMKGFISIPAPAGKKPWREVFVFSPSFSGDRLQIEARYRELAKQRHPDAGGSVEAMAELNAARAEALREI